MKTIKLRCLNCSKDFEKDISEYNRRIRNGKKEFYCTRKCAGIGNNSKKRMTTIEKQCPICGNSFTTKKGAKEITYCSRSCASKGSVNEKRREAGRKSARINFTPDTHNIFTIQKLLKKRETWKYKKIEEFLNLIGEKYEFEYVMDEKYVYDLVLFDKGVIIEFDGPEHRNMNEKNKEKVAQNNGYKFYRVSVEPNTVIEVDLIKHILE